MLSASSRISGATTYICHSIACITGTDLSTAQNMDEGPSSSCKLVHMMCWAFREVLSVQVGLNNAEFDAQ